MKKIITLIILLANLIGKAQCPTPTNLTLSIPNATSAELSWSDNGTSNFWETTVVPDFIVGTPLPSGGFITTSTNTALFTNLPPTYGCYVFFVRTVCSATDFSPWVAVGTLGCSANVYNWLATLSNNNFNSESKGLQIFPNPASSILFIDNIEKQIQKIEIFDLQGRLLKTINENKEKYQIDISNFSSATYLVKLSTEKGTQTVKVVRN